MTLNQLIDDVLLEARNSNIGESEKLSRHQIELWIKSYRAYLIKLDIDKGRTVNPMYTQILNMHISKVENETLHYEYVSDENLPALIDFHFKPGVVAVKDSFGNLILLGSETKMKFLKYRKYTCQDYIAYTKDNKIYVEGSDNQLLYIDVTVIAEDPTNSKMCYDPDKDEYPLPAAMWATVKDLIFTKDFRNLSLHLSDVTNDSNDDLQNAYSVNSRPRT